MLRINTNDPGRYAKHLECGGGLISHRFCTATPLGAVKSVPEEVSGSEPEHVSAGEYSCRLEKEPPLRQTTIAVLLILLLGISTDAAAKRRAAGHPTPDSVVVQADAYTVDRDDPLQASAAFGVLANDTELRGQPLTATVVTAPTQGTLVLNLNGSFTYTVTSATAAADSFTYAGSNGTESKTAVVTLTIVDAPVAVSDAYTVTGTTLTVAAPGVLANDTPHGAAIIAYGATGGEQTDIGESAPTALGGTVRLSADGSFTYTRPGAISGTDSFLYLLGNAAGFSPALVRLTLPASNAIDFTVTSPGFFYAFSGLPGQNPELTLQRGRTYRFDVRTDSSHPIEILDAPPGSVTNNNISRGILTFTVPAAAESYRYLCSVHAFGNVINTVP
jgi:hypothetical protein